MKISDYFTKVKNLIDALASIGATIDDEDLMAVTLNGLGKDYSQFHTSIWVWETFPDFQDLIMLFISEEMKIVSISSNGGSEESVFYSNTNTGRNRGGKTSFRSWHKSSHGGHHQHEVKLMEVNKEILGEEEVEEIVEVMVEIIEVNN